MPSILAFGKFLTRRRTEEGALVLRTGSIQERDFLLQNDPAAFFITDHYRNYPAVLAKLEEADPAVIRELLESSWRRLAPKRVLKVLDATKPTGAPAP